MTTTPRPTPSSPEEKSTSHAPSVPPSSSPATDFPALPDIPTLSDIRKTCAFVTDRANHVHLNHQNLKDFAKTITTPPDHWLITNPHNLLSLPLPLLVTILLYFEVIDYSFWPDPTSSSLETYPITTKTPHAAPQPPQKWTIEIPSDKFDGSVALLYLLIRNFQQNPALDFTTFSDFDFYNFFHPGTITQAHPQPSPQTHPGTHLQTHQQTHLANPVSTPISTVGKIPLLATRAETLRETSRILRDKLGNNFYAITKNLTSDEQLFHFLITTFPSFRDQRTYIPQNSKTSPSNSITPATTSRNPESAPKTIYFYKLAQLLTSDLLFIRRHLEHIDVNTKNLPGCADYKIPQTLRALGLITYSTELSKLVDTQQLIPENSPYEVEIRAATVSAIDFLHDELPQFSPIQINDYLFLTSRSLARKQPYHLTRNVNY